MFSSKCKKKILGFTFLEIMVSVAIVAILASISIIATTRVRIKSRDIKRISNATEIVSALEAYYAANQSYPTMIFPGQPIESNGREYLRAVPSNPSPRTDGGCADSDYTYVTTSTGYKLTFCIGSDNSRFAQGVVICKNGNCGIKEDCSGEVQDEEGIRYPIVRIGEQCWMASHLKSKRRPEPEGGCVNIAPPSFSPYIQNEDTCITTYPIGLYNEYQFGGYGCYPAECILGSRRDCIKTLPPIIPISVDFTGWSNRGHDIAESYNYPPDDTSDCNFRGALYTWPGAMNLDDDCVDTSCAPQVAVPFHRGICPENWHIPSDEEFHISESSLTQSGNTCDPDRNRHESGADSCQNAGTELVTGDFDSILLGVRETIGGAYFSGIDTKVYFWTSNEASSTSATTRIIEAGVSGTYRAAKEKVGAFAVRCIRDY